MVDSFLLRFLNFKCCEEEDQTLEKDKQVIQIDENNDNEKISLKKGEIYEDTEKESFEIMKKREFFEEKENYTLIEKKDSKNFDSLGEKLFEKSTNIQSNEIIKLTDTYQNRKVSDFSKTKSNEELKHTFTTISNINDHNVTLFSDNSMYNILVKQSSNKIKYENFKVINKHCDKNEILKSSKSISESSEIIMKIYNLKGNFLANNKIILINKYGMINEKAKYFGFTVFGFKIGHIKNDKMNLMSSAFSSYNEKDSSQLINDSDISSGNPFQIFNRNNSQGTFVDISLEKKSIFNVLNHMHSTNVKNGKEFYFQFFFIFFNTCKYI